MVKKSALDVRQVLNRVDIFGKPLPGFNLKGSDVVTTMVGGVSSIFIFAIVLLYGAIKFIHLQSKANPNVATYIREGSFSSADILDLNDMNFRIAFAVEGFRSKDLKIDP